MQTISHFLVRDVVLENFFKAFDKDNTTLRTEINVIRYCRYFKTILISTPDSLSQQLFLICNVSIFTCIFSPELISKRYLHFLSFCCHWTTGIGLTTHHLQYSKLAQYFSRLNMVNC